VTLPTSYDYLQVTLSAIIAVSASYAALDLAGRVTAASGWPRFAWFAGGATAMGIGIWSTHFTAMLAFRLPIPIRYHWPTVLLSLMAGLVSSAFALYIASRKKMGPVRALNSSVIMGIGIAALHYIAMEAMRLAAAMHFNPFIVALAVLFAMGFSLLALLLTFDLREESRGTPLRKILSSLVMGAAILGMHFTGMASANFVPSASFVPSARPTDLSNVVNIDPLETLGISTVTMLILVLSVVTSAVDRRFYAQRLQLAWAESKVVLNHTVRVGAMDELTTSLAHEINQPLTAVVTEVSASLRWLALQPPNLDEARSGLARAIRQANRASDVIGRVRALLKKTPPPMRGLDVNEVVHEVLVLARNELQGHGVRAKTETTVDVPLVLGDRIQLQQLMLNLIINGIDAMSMVNDRPRELIIKSALHPDGVLIQVQDTGEGLDPEKAQRIFEPFFTSKPEGIGMGLSISRSIVEAHGGRLWATPRSPHGAIFQFTLHRAGKEK
jgi:NO-binding membrane sensor protein with MHYT domain